MVPKYNAVITVRGTNHGVKHTRRVENKPMPFIVNQAKDMAEYTNEMNYKPVVNSINIRFWRIDY